jgi:ATP-dependent DNA ligase I
VLLSDLVATSEAVAGTSSRTAKIELVAAALGRLAPDEVPAGVAYLAGDLRQRQIGVGWALLRDPPAPTVVPTLTVGEVDRACERIGALAGPGSINERKRLLANLMGRATATEQRFLQRLLVGELRQGALEGVMLEAVARAAGVPSRDLRRAAMLAGDLGAVAAAALDEGGAAALAGFRLQVGRPLAPMLAQTAEDPEGALAKVGPAAIEWKIDGARSQIHRSGDDVAIFTRTLDDITGRMPEVVEIVRGLPGHDAVLDGEVIALRPDGRPFPFQTTMSRVGARRGSDELRAAIPLTPFVFDVLHLDGEDVLDRPLTERLAALDLAVPEAWRVPRLLDASPAAAVDFLDDAVARGHEGAMVKSLSAPYEAGRRGAGWLKVKPAHTFDLVVLAAEWGHGRRRGWLSNLHLGARDPANGGFVMLGKTFKGLTDELLAWQTTRFLELEIARDEWTVYVRPEQVVEIAFDGVQTSPRYPGGVALRFARVKRYRDDKPASEANTIDEIKAIHARSHT